jgi:hypothetical protein
VAQRADAGEFFNNQQERRMANDNSTISLKEVRIRVQTGPGSYDYKEFSLEQALRLRVLLNTLFSDRSDSLLADIRWKAECEKPAVAYDEEFASANEVAPLPLAGASP